MAKNGRLLFLICSLSALASVGVHIYLTGHHYDFKFGQDVSEGICNINEQLNCNKTTASSYSEFLGIPISIFGGLVNFLLLCLLLAYRFPIVSAATQEKLAGPIKVVSLFIFGTSLVMGSISLGVLNTVCPACSVTYLLSLFIFASAWALLKGQPLFSGMELKLFPIAGVSILAFAYFVHHNNMRDHGGSEVAELTRLQVQDWEGAPAMTVIPISPMQMNPNPSAKMKIVEFADFLCGHCANAYPTIKRFMATHPDVEFSYQAFPLDGECNSAIEFSRGSNCLLARLSYCASEQGAPWKTQEWIYKNQRELVTNEGINKEFADKAKDLGLDFNKLSECADTQRVRNIITEQAKLGVDVGVKGTPTMFINGKKVRSGFSIPLLQEIYKKINQ